MKEKDIERSILDYLARVTRNATPCKIELSGIPDKKSKTGMRPFMSPHHHRYFSDIFFLCRGVAFFFEVKNDDKKVIRKVHRAVEIAKIYPNKISTIEIMRIVKQYRFIHRMILNGGYGGFVCSIEDVQDIMEQRRRRVFVTEGRRC